jgi:hypothetical protein
MSAKFGSKIDAKMSSVMSGALKLDFKGCDT